MKINHLLFACLMCSVIYGCHEPSKTPASNAPLVKDTRPKEEIDFLNRIKSESQAVVYLNSLQRDNKVKAFNKYVIDSLKSIQSWEMIVDEIDDMEYYSSSFAKGILMTDEPIYNLKLVAPVKFNESVDSVVVDKIKFVYTILKNPKGAELNKQLSIMNTLQKGDTVLVSGSVTYLDENLKVNFDEVYESLLPWNIDLLITDIKKKGAK